MKQDTPLTEVAAFLPVEAAEWLVDDHPAIQRIILEAMRAAVYEWERRGVQLDPLEFDVVITTMVRDLLSAYRETLAVIIERDSK